MNAIDWVGLARNALWIAGLSIALATWSYVTWLAGRRKVRLREALGYHTTTISLSLGMLLLSAGLAWGATRAWERALWIFLALAFAGQIFVAARHASVPKAARADGRHEGGFN